MRSGSRTRSLEVSAGPAAGPRCCLAVSSWQLALFNGSPETRHFLPLGTAGPVEILGLASVQAGANGAMSTSLGQTLEVSDTSLTFHSLGVPSS